MSTNFGQTSLRIFVIKCMQAWISDLFCQMDVHCFYYENFGNSLQGNMCGKSKRISCLQFFICVESSNLCKTFIWFCHQRTERSRKQIVNKTHKNRFLMRRKFAGSNSIWTFRCVVTITFLCRRNAYQSGSYTYQWPENWIISGLRNKPIQ